MPEELLKSSTSDQLTPVNARTGPEINNIVCAAHRFLIVLHHDQRVASGLQDVQGCQQLLIIPRVETDGRLVENIEHAAEVRAELGGKPDALGFPAGQGSDATAELQIAEPDFREKLKPLPDLG